MWMRASAFGVATAIALAITMGVPAAMEYGAAPSMVVDAAPSMVVDAAPSLVVDAATLPTDATQVAIEPASIHVIAVRERGTPVRWLSFFTGSKRAG
jgi:hypothetical protein